MFDNMTQAVNETSGEIMPVMMYVDLVDPFYNATLYYLSPDNLGPLDDSVQMIKIYLSELNEFVLNFSVESHYPNS